MTDAGAQFDAAVSDGGSHAPAPGTDEDSSAQPAHAAESAQPAHAAQSAQPAHAAEPEPPARAGANDLGRIDIADGAVAKIAARAALEVPDAGGAAPRLLGRSVTAPLIGRQTSLNAVPKCDVKVDGGMAFVELTISVRWPASIPDTAAAVRNRVASRVLELAGVEVGDVDIEVSDLVTSLPPAPRVR